MNLYAGPGRIEPVHNILDYRHMNNVPGAVVELAPIDGAPALTMWLPLTELQTEGGVA